jgi:hypothetical protein
VFLLQVSLPDQSQTALAFAYGLVPARYTHAEWASRVGLDTGDYLPFITALEASALRCALRMPAPDRVTR